MSQTKIDELIESIIGSVKEQGIDMDEDDFDFEYDDKSKNIFVTSGTKNVKIKITNKFNQHD